MKNFITLCLWALIPTLLMLPEAKAQPAGWQFFTPLQITEQSGALLTDYQLRLELNTQTLIGSGNMQADGDDIRFGLDVMGNTLLNYWIESGLNTPTTVIWVKVPALAASAVTTIFLFYGNNSAPGVSNIDGTFVGPHSSTDSVASGNAGGVTDSQRGFRFAPNEDILVKRFGKNEPNGSTRYVTLFDFSTQAIVRQHQVSGPAGQYSYSDLSSPLWLTQSTQYLLILYQGATDGYYFGVSSQIGQHLTYYDMRYCNSCDQNTFPTLVLPGYQYGYPDFHYYTKQNISPAPTYVVCPTFSAAPANVTITNSSCNASCQTIPGSITAPTGTPCPLGSTLQYSVASGPWTTTLPMYAGLTSTDSIKTRCICDANPIITSPVSPAISVNPANCADVTPPTVTCSNMTVTFNGQESISLNVNSLAMANDNCGTPSLSISTSSISCLQVGQSVPVTVTAIDASNNTATCTSTITVGGLPCGWSQNPNGVNCENGNSISYNAATGVYTATSTNCFYGPPFTADETAFAQRTLCGNGSMTALVTNISGSALGWAGVVMRESNAAGVKKAQLMTNLGSDHRREFRTATNGAAQPQQFPSHSRYWLRITRVGNQFTMFVSSNGINWFPAGAQNIVMDNCIQMGLVVTNYTANSSVTATFSNVSFTGSNPTSEVNINEIAESVDAPHGFEVYPNPTGGALNVDLTSYVGRAVRLEVYSLEGKLLQFMEIDEVQTTVEQMNISNLSNGVHLLKAKSAGIPDITNRIVLQKD